jgi:hypothetical protein
MVLAVPIELRGGRVGHNLISVLLGTLSTHSQSCSESSYLRLQRLELLNHRRVKLVHEKSYYAIRLGLVLEN